MSMLNRTLYECPNKGKKFFEQIQPAWVYPAVGIRIIQVTGYNAMGIYMTELASVSLGFLPIINGPAVILFRERDKIIPVSP